MERPRVISMEVSASGRSDCYFRILANRSVKYITIKAGALDTELLDDMPLDFQDILPPLPYQDDTWNAASITRNPSSCQLEVTLSSVELPRVETIWHPRMVDCLDIERTEYLTPLTQECKWKAEADSSQDSEGGTIIAKMARFHWETPYMEAEMASLERQLAETTGRGSGLM